MAIASYLHRRFRKPHKIEIADEATHRPRQFGFEPTSFCMWGAKPAGMALPNSTLKD
jgi:hypothetical protein